MMMLAVDADEGRKPALREGREGGGGDPSLDVSLATLFECLPAMISYWDAEQRNVYANRAYLAWLGLGAADLRGRRIVDLAPAALYARILPLVERAYRGEAQSDEQVIESPGGGRRYWVVNYVPDLRKGVVAGIVVILCEVSALKETEQALRESERRLRSILGGQTEAISRLGVDGRFLFVNDAYCALSGRAREELLGQRWQPVAHPDDVARVEASLRTLSPSNDVVIEENRVVCGNGELRWVQFINRGFFDELGVLREIQCVGRDITAQKVAELALQEANANLERRVVERTRQLQELAVQITLAEESERKAIARDLHDDLGQLLHIAQMRLDQVQRSVGDDALVAALVQVGGLIRDASRRVRSMTAQLSPPVLRTLGLVSALHWLADEMGREFGLDVEVDVEPVGTDTDGGKAIALGEAQSLILFRAVRELLLNVLKHAGTFWAQVRVEHAAHFLRITVRDEGRGIEDLAAALDQRERFGLASLQERIGYLHGTVVIDSAPGRGTSVRLQVPLGSSRGSGRRR